MDGPDRERERVGLCHHCVHGRVKRSARGSAFWRCAQADRDARLPRYPPLPVTACVGYAPRPAPSPDRG